jgi:hypothetical protein
MSHFAQESRELHNHYLRFSHDLAWAHYPIILRILVKRFFCLMKPVPSGHL